MVWRAPVTARVALPWVTDPVTPGDVVGTAPPLALIVVPVPPVTDVGELVAVGPELVDGPVAAAGEVGTGPSEGGFELHAAVRSASAHTTGIARFLRTSTPFTAG